MANGDDDEPETFECLGKGANPRVFACGGGQDQWLRDTERTIAMRVKMD